MLATHPIAWPVVVIPAGLAAVFIVAAFNARTKVPLAWSLFWTAFAGWEFLLENHVGCDLECNIRVELLMGMTFAVASPIHVITAEVSARRAERRRAEMPIGET